MNYDAIFFDWDGVITDSVNIKTNSFCEMFKDYGDEIQEKVKEYHLTHGGISRFEKFRFFYNEFLHKELSQHEIINLSERFSQLVKRKVIEAPYVKGALETIRSEYKKNTLLFIVTGTPTDEMKEIVICRNLLKYFKEIGGAPQKKKNILECFLKKYNLCPQRCIFLGDALTDYQAAAACNVKFIGIKIESCVTQFPENLVVYNEVKL